MTYRVIYKNDSLEHGGLWDSAKKGLERAGHKYLKREWKNGRWHYTYKTSLERNRDAQRQNRFQSKMESDYYEKQGNSSYANYLRKGYYAERGRNLDKKRKKIKSRPKNVKQAISNGKAKLEKFFSKSGIKVSYAEAKIHRGG